jgi:hypothetical protein
MQEWTPDYETRLTVHEKYGQFVTNPRSIFMCGDHEETKNETSILIEEGKRYVRRDGKVIGPMEIYEEHEESDYKWYDPTDSETYTDDGRYYVKEPNSEFNIVAVYEETDSQIVIEEGKRYLDREGSIIGPMKPNEDRNEDSNDFIWLDHQNNSYMSNGNFYNTGTISEYDLIKEYEEPKPEEPPTPELKIEAGKRYIRRDGVISGPIEPNPNTYLYPWFDSKNSYTYASNGNYYADADITKIDLIEEYIEPVTEQEINIIVETEMQINDDGSLKETPEKAKTDIAASGVAQVPFHAIEQIGSIFKEGELKYGRDNWLKGVGDKPYQEQRAEHALRHLMLWMQGDRSENHLAKVGWFSVTQMELERRENKSNE